MDYFGGRNVSGLIGILYTSAAFGTLIGPTAAGFAFDLAHNYLTPILISAICNVIAAMVMAVTSSQLVRPARCCRGEKIQKQSGAVADPASAVKWFVGQPTRRF
jgi:MFS family permease